MQFRNCWTNPINRITAEQDVDMVVRRQRARRPNATTRCIMSRLVLVVVMVLRPINHPPSSCSRTSFCFSILKHDEMTMQRHPPPHFIAETLSLFYWRTLDHVVRCTGAAKKYGAALKSCTQHEMLIKLCILEVSDRNETPSLPSCPQNNFFLILFPPGGSLSLSLQNELCVRRSENAIEQLNIISRFPRLSIQFIPSICLL